MYLADGRKDLVHGDSPGATLEGGGHLSSLTLHSYWGWLKSSSLELPPWTSPEGVGLR